MLCPYCGNSDSKVIDSRDSKESVRRRRECFLCGLRFTTYERIQTRVLMIIKNDGRREEFSRDKLKISLTKACAKRPLPIGSIEKMIDEIEAQLASLGRAEIPSKTIGELAMERLKDLDRVAYIRFTSVYRDFTDIESFKGEIEELLIQNEKGTSANQLSFLEDFGGNVLSRQRRRDARRKGSQSDPPNG